MRNTIIKKSLALAMTGLCSLILVGCSTFRTIIEKKSVAGIPEGRYERIIKLYNPEKTPDKTLAGIVFIKEGARICTDYPREETIKSLDDLDMLEKNAYRSFSLYAVESEGITFGYFAISLENRALIFKNSKDEGCLYKIVIIEPEPPGGYEIPAPQPPGVR